MTFFFPFGEQTKSEDQFPQRAEVFGNCVILNLEL